MASETCFSDVIVCELIRIKRFSFKKKTKKNQIYTLILYKLHFNFCMLTFYFSFSFLATLQHMKFLGQGSDPSQSCDLSHSSSNSRSFTHCAKREMEPQPSSPKMLLILVVPHQELHMWTFIGQLC